MGMAESLENFRRLYRTTLQLPTTPARICTASGATFKSNVSLKRSNGLPSEQYFKWQLIFGLIQAGLIDPDCVGTELSIPRGSKGSTNLYIDVAIFKDASWIAMYNALATSRAPSAGWEQLIDLVVSCGEIKDDVNDDPDRTISRQLIPALNALSQPYTIGFYYNSGHLVVFSRAVDTGRPVLLRLDPVKQGVTGTGVAALNTAVPDSYSVFPPHALILRRSASGPNGSRTGRTIGDLDVTSSRSQGSVKAALDGIKRILDQVSMASEVGYRVVVETLATKLFDEKRSDAHSVGLDFFIDGVEALQPSGTLTGNAKKFRDRLRNLHTQARDTYPAVLAQSAITWGNTAHVRIIAEVVRGFQDVSFIRSTRSDLYQVVFYNFAAPLSKAEQAQFITPLGVIDFMVRHTAPKPAEDVCDPTMGIADFLAETFRYQLGLLKAAAPGRVATDGSAEPVVMPPAGNSDQHLYGIDNDANMRMLAALNMLLNGDGQAHLHHVGDTGSLDHKFAVSTSSNTVETVFLPHDDHVDGKWEFDDDAEHSLKHFHVVLTNPPFGDQRALKLDDPAQGAANRSLARLYAVRNSISGNQIDRGLLFLENAVRILRDDGRFAIILSTSLAGVKEYEAARLWLLSQVRIVGLFDLPENIFAETGVPTTIIVGYKPTQSRLSELQKMPYEVFTRRIARVGFFKATRKRTSLLLPKYLIDPLTGVVQHDSTSGEPLLDSEFDQVIEEFQDWCKGQEPKLASIFSASMISS